MKIKVRNNNGSCLIQFTHQGKRYSITRGQYSNKKDRAYMELIAQEIDLDRLKGELDESLAKYKKWIKKESNKEVTVDSLIELWKLWIDHLKTNGLSEQTFFNKYKSLQNKIENSNASLYSIDWFLDSTNGNVAFNEQLQKLKSCYEWGINRKLISINPYTEIKPKKRIKKEIQPFTKSEIKLILLAIETNKFTPDKQGFTHSWYLHFFRFLFSTGLRPSEVIGLRWSDLDFNSNLIHIRNSLAVDHTTTNKTRKLKETKTGNKWTIPLTETLKRIIQDSIKQSKLNHIKTEFIFVSESGDNIKWDSIRSQVWKRVLNGLGMPYRNPYQIRHTVLSHAAMNPEIGLLGASRIAGHKTTETTSRNYARFVGLPELPDMDIFSNPET